MNRIVYLNGAFLPEAEAKISIFDRGFLMADSIYEASAILDGKLVDHQRHLDRMKRSLGEIGLANPYDDEQWWALHRRLIAENRVDQGLLYWQISRGVADRDFVFSSDLTPTVIAFTQAKRVDGPVQGWRVITQPDQRWQRRDIKTTQLLSQSLAKMAAKAAGADDCWFVEDGFITEGSSNNAWIICGDRAITRPPSHSILNGITRRAQIEQLAAVGLRLVEQPFTVAEALQADEAFITSATTFAQPVIALDGQPIGSGEPGPKTLQLRARYLDFARTTAR